MTDEERDKLLKSLEAMFEKGILSVLFYAKENPDFSVSIHTFIDLYKDIRYKIRTMQIQKHLDPGGLKND